MKMNNSVNKAHIEGFIKYLDGSFTGGSHKWINFYTGTMSVISNLDDICEVIKCAPYFIGLGDNDTDLVKKDIIVFVTNIYVKYCIACDHGVSTDRFFYTKNMKDLSIWYNALKDAISVNNKIVNDLKKIFKDLTKDLPSNPSCDIVLENDKDEYDIITREVFYCQYANFTINTFFYNNRIYVSYNSGHNNISAKSDNSRSFGVNEIRSHQDIYEVFAPIYDKAFSDSTMFLNKTFLGREGE